MSISTLSQFARSLRSRFIRIVEKSGEEVFSINVATSLAVTYPDDNLGRTLSFYIDYQLPDKRTYYILFDSGIAI